eukprot:CAMPEP_0177684080 /NCGR_PEP_ID=MMETSP0447-20121125/32203_1 /TAXON_ID=0 /ORGANISM="Stygamoeba regulata, Strain BSH-02190019" /LENGTH=33 /DNA_ID= /DNA_START= /DNA_END= /DNA_ORIENTATION=
MSTFTAESENRGGLMEMGPDQDASAPHLAATMT